MGVPTIWVIMLLQSRGLAAREVQKCHGCGSCPHPQHIPYNPYITHCSSFHFFHYPNLSVLLDGFLKRSWHWSYVLFGAFGVFLPHALGVRLESSLRCCMVWGLCLQNLWWQWVPNFGISCFLILENIAWILKFSACINETNDFFVIKGSAIVDSPGCFKQIWGRVGKNRGIYNPKALNTGLHGFYGALKHS